MKLIMRTITGLFVLILTVFFIYMGGIYLLSMGLILSSIAIIEIDNALNYKKNYKKLLLNVIFNIIFNIAVFYNNFKLALALLSIVCIIEMIIYTFFVDEKNFVLKDSFIYLYVSVTFSLIYLFSNTPLIWLLYICSWGTDTSAYCIGMLFGKNKLTPISPKKTVEGAIGGVVGSLILGIIFAAVNDNLTIFMTIFIVLLGSLFSQMGDICASKIKREAGIKDYGNIFIGHGGVMDRFDSVLFVIPYLAIISVLWFN